MTFDRSHHKLADFTHLNSTHQSRRQLRFGFVLALQVCPDPCVDAFPDLFAILFHEYHVVVAMDANFT